MASASGVGWFFPVNNSGWAAPMAAKQACRSMSSRVNMTPLSALPAGKANLTGRVAASALHAGYERGDAAYRICLSGCRSMQAGASREPSIGCRGLRLRLRTHRVVL